MHILQRFIDRIGKTVYRDAVSCPCQSCKDWTEKWIEIWDKIHAQYLYDVQCDMWTEYRDIK